MNITLATYRREKKSELDSPAIQTAMDACSAAGGGTVRLTAGTWRCGSLFLRNGVTLQLDKGAVIVGSPRLEDYPVPTITFVDAVGDVRGRALICAERVQDIAIVGEGVIDGNGGSFPLGSPSYKVRPFLVRLAYSRNIRIAGVALRSAAAWTCHLLGCENAEIRGVAIDSRINENNDGIDVDSCRNVRISDCDIASDDDAICLKATLPLPCEDISISNCTMSTECSGLKCGTESYGDIRRVSMRNCRIIYAATGAVKLLTSDGGIFEDIEISDIVIERGTAPIFFRLGARCRTYAPNCEKKGPGKLRRVKVSRLKATVFLPPKDIVQPFSQVIMPARAFSGVIFTGVPGHCIEDVGFEDIDIRFCGGGVAEDIHNQPPEQPETYPEHFYFGAPPSSCFYLRHARNITFTRVKASLQQPDARPALAFDDVAGFAQTECEWPGQ